MLETEWWKSERFVYWNKRFGWWSGLFKWCRRRHDVAEWLTERELRVWDKIKEMNDYGHAS